MTNPWLIGWVATLGTLSAIALGLGEVISGEALTGLLGSVLGLAGGYASRAAQDRPPPPDLDV